MTLGLALISLDATAQSLCTSDQQPQPVAVLERFINADCDTCWRDAATARPAADELVLDWILPGNKGDDAPLSMGTSSDGVARLQALGRPVPARADSLRSTVESAPVHVRVAQGQPVNDYIGTSVELQPAGRWQVWLLLVESLPAGSEGSPVARNLVRNAFRPDWDRVGPPASENEPLKETRSMQIHEGAQPSRLRLAVLVEDSKGRIRAITQTACHP